MCIFVEIFGFLYLVEDLQVFFDEVYLVVCQCVILVYLDYVVWLLECDGVVVGYVVVGLCGLLYLEVVLGDGEFKWLYLIKDEQSCGWGSWLLEMVLDWFECDGLCMLWLGVWLENFGVQCFYVCYGFSKVGIYEFLVGMVCDLEFILWCLLMLVC